MLVPTMNRHEVTAEVHRDNKKIKDITLQRLMNEYDRERKKLKIRKTDVYHKAYPIKTGAKNNWIIFIEKSPGADCYSSVADVGYCCVVYYYSKDGLLVLRPQRDREDIEVFFGHVFTRYNQRLRLNINSKVEIIKSYFKVNGYSNGEYTIKDGKKYLVSICKEGMMLGTYYTDPEWLVHKTFISNDLKRPDQDKREKQMMLDLQMELCCGKIPYRNHLTNLHFANDVFVQIMGKEKAAPADFNVPFDLPASFPPINHIASSTPWLIKGSV